MSESALFGSSSLGCGEDNRCYREQAWGVKVTQSKVLVGQAIESGGTRGIVACTHPSPDQLLHRLRLAEIDLIRPLFPASGRILEIGGGSGYQASVIAAWGYEVESIDVKASDEFFPVRSYDGEHIPCPSASVDLIFSSNVLEHVPSSKLPVLLEETRRILRDGGVSIHLLPTPSWRALNSAAHYPFVFRTLRAYFTRVPEAMDVSVNMNAAKSDRSARALRFLKWSFAGPLRAHGEYASALSELYYFSRRRWSRVFRDAGFQILSVQGNGLVYSGCAICPWLSMSWRRRLSNCLGSACNVFVVR
jgi:SAM-dependent methyltransferase